jgi:hypothetical protein
MKKLLLSMLALSLMLWLGCGGDDEPTGPDGPTIVTVTAATGSTAPARLSVEDTVWNRITPTTVAVTADRFVSAGKRRPVSAQAVAGSVEVQALVVSEVLFLRLAWEDDTWDRWPGRFAVVGFQYQGADTLANFLQDALSFREDQAMVLFQSAGDAIWDVWNWRLATTGAGYLAEGYTLSGTSLLRDAGDAEVAVSNLGFGGQPAYMHLEGPANEDYRLIEGSVATMDHTLPWSLGQFVSGWIIDDSLYLPHNASARSSRFDIGAYSRHSSPPGEYVVVLQRALNTGDAADLNMTDYTTLDVRIGITNNADFTMSAGDSRQGFSSTFKLKLP